MFSLHVAFTSPALPLLEGPVAQSQLPLLFACDHCAVLCTTAEGLSSNFCFCAAPVENPYIDVMCAWLCACKNG